MAKKDTVNEQKELIEATPEEVEKLEEEISESNEDLPIEGAETKKEETEVEQPRKEFKRMSKEERKAQRDAESHQRALESWIPKTQLGKDVKHGKEKDLNKVLSSGRKVLEAEIIDTLLPGLQTDLALIGQAKGKFGGGKRRAWRQTQKKTMEGNVLTFSCMALVGDKKGHVGVGYGKSKETLPSREKAIRNAKLNLIKIARGFESPEIEPENAVPHTVPYIVEGKCSSVKIKLIPAPRGTGLVIANECKKLLRLAGIKDIYGVSSGQTRTTFNLVKACLQALSKTSSLKL